MVQKIRICPATGNKTECTDMCLFCFVYNNQVTESIDEAKIDNGKKKDED